MERKCRRVVAKVCGEGKNKNDFFPPKSIDFLLYLKTSQGSPKNYLASWCFCSHTTQILLISLLNCSFLRNRDMIQKFSDILVLNCCGLLNQSSWIWYSSLSFPSRINSSFWAWDTEHVMPGFIRNLWMYFSPPKFWISAREPFWIKVLMGEFSSWHSG